MKTKQKKLLLKLKNNKNVVLYSLLLLLIFFFGSILGNFLVYSSYEDEIEQYNIVEFQELGILIRDSSLNKIENTVNMYIQNDILLETAEYLELSTSKIVENTDNITEQNIELLNLIHTKDEDYYYEPIKQNNTNYINILLLFFIVLLLVIKHKEIIKFIYDNSSNKDEKFLKKLYKYSKYFIIILTLIVLIFSVYFGKNYMDYQLYKVDIEKYELTNYQNLGFVIKESTLEKIEVEIQNQKELETLIKEAEELGININEVLLPSMTNTEMQIEELSLAIEDYVSQKSTD